MTKYKLLMGKFKERDKILQSELENAKRRLSEQERLLEQLKNEKEPDGNPPAQVLLVSKNAEIETLSEEVKRLKTKLESEVPTANDTETLQTKLQTNSKELEDLRMSLEKETSSRINELQVHHADQMERLHKDWSQRLEEVKAQKEREIELLKQRLNESQKNTSDEKRDALEKRSHPEKTTNELSDIARLHSELKALKEEKVKAESQSKAFEELENDRNILLKEVQKLSTENSKLESEKEDLAMQSEESEKQLSHIKTLYSKALKENEESKSKCTSGQSHIKDIQNNDVKLELREEIEKLQKELENVLSLRDDQFNKLKDLLHKYESSDLSNDFTFDSKRSDKSAKEGKGLEKNLPEMDIEKVIKHLQNALEVREDNIKQLNVRFEAEARNNEHHRALLKENVERVSSLEEELLQLTKAKQVLEQQARITENNHVNENENIDARQPNPNALEAEDTVNSRRATDKQLKNELSLLREKTSNMETLERELKMAKLSLNNLENEKQDLQVRADMLQSHLESLEKEKAERVTGNEPRNHEYTQIIEDLKNKLQQKDEENKTDKRAMKEMEDKLAAQANKAGTPQKKPISLEETLSKFSSHLSQMKEELNDVKSQFRRESAKYLLDLRNDVFPALEKMKSIKERHKTDFLQYKRQNENKMQELVRTNEDYKMFRVESEKSEMILKKTLDETLEKLKIAENSLKSSHDESSRLVRDLKAAQDTNKLVSEEFEKAKGEITNLRTEVETSSKTIIEGKNEQRSLERKLEALSKKSEDAISEFKQKLQDAEKVNLTSVQKIQELENNIVDYKQKLQIVESKLIENQEARNQSETALEQELNAIYEKNRELEEKLNKAQDDMQVYRSKTREAIKKATSAQKEAQDAEKALKAEIEMISKERDDLLDQIECLDKEQKTEQAKEVRELQEQIEMLVANSKSSEEEHKQKLHEAETRNLSIREESEEKEKKFHQKINQLEEKHSAELKTIKADFRLRSERARKVIEDKDKEIKLLRGGESDDRKASRKQSEVATSRKSEYEILRLAKQQAGRDIEIQKLKQEINQLRETLSKKISDLEMKENVNSTLEEKLQKLEELESRRAEFKSDGADGFTFNFEYLKNIVFSYMLSRNIQERAQLTTVIATILHFTPEEAQKVNEEVNGQKAEEGFLTRAFQYIAPAQ